MTIEEVGEFSAVKQNFGKSSEQEKDRIAQTKVNIRKARSRSVSKEREKNFDRDR